MSEMKGEVRREMEAMNMKMSQLEQQIATILDILKSQGHLNSLAGSSRGHFRSSVDSNVTTELPNPDVKDDYSCSKEKQQNLVIDSSEFNNLNVNTKPKKEEEDPLPHWLAPPDSAKSRLSHESIPDWEEDKSLDNQQNAANAARMLNENKPASPDPRIMQTLNLFKRK